MLLLGEIILDENSGSPLYNIREGRIRMRLILRGR
jgi:hypothetical protein